MVDRNGDLRVFQVTLRQHLAKFCFDFAERQPASLDATDQRERKDAVGIDAELAREIRLTEYRYRDDVLRADRIARWLRGGPADGQQEDEASDKCGPHDLAPNSDHWNDPLRSS